MGRWRQGRGRWIAAAGVVAIAVEACARREGDPAVLVASSEKIKRELGWMPQFAELDTIVASAWEWHQRRYA